MITFGIWRAIRRPQTWHILFQRTIQRLTQAPPRWYLWPLALFLLPVFSPALILAGTAYGFVWAEGIAATIMQERSSKRYELMALMPDGELKSCWLLTTAYLSLSQAFVRINNGGLWALRLILILILVPTFLPTTTAQEAIPQQPATILILLAVILLIINHFQSIVISILVGMLTPALVTDLYTARLMAVGVYSVIQTTTYVLASPPLFALLWAIHPENGVALVTVILIALVQIIVFAIIRELVIYLLWRGLLFQLNTSTVEAMKVSGLVG